MKLLKSLHPFFACSKNRKRKKMNCVKSRALKWLVGLCRLTMSINEKVARLMLITAQYASSLANIEVGILFNILTKYPINADKVHNRKCRGVRKEGSWPKILHEMSMCPFPSGEGLSIVYEPFNLPIHFHTSRSATKMPNGLVFSNE